MYFQTFTDLDIPVPFKRALQEMRFQSPTPIQARAIPAGLGGRDVVGTAQTGTGKTAAFGIPLLASLHGRPGTLALVLAPTRELAAQIHDVLRKIAKGSGLEGTLVVGGESFHRQADALERGVDYIVATPGRLNDHLNEGTARLSDVGILVLDEVDRMLDMGFLPQLRTILQEIPRDRQTLLFSATLPREVASLVDDLVEDPVRIAVGGGAAPAPKVKEEIRRIRSDEKTDLLLSELEERRGRVLVFTRTKSRANRLHRVLEREGLRAVVLHGGKSQGQRKHSLEKFRTGSHRVLVATDLAGRGLDIAQVEHVINYDVPNTREDYIHRIGRTGRAGNEGSALSFVVVGEAMEEAVVTGARPSKPAAPPSGARGGPRGRRGHHAAGAQRGFPSSSRHRRGGGRR